MTFLPIVDRELRTASRKAWTFWLRVVAAGAAVLIASAFLLLAVVESINTAQLGGWLFGILTWLSLAIALSVGLFFTSDCLSEEKREGTLGFLFLTDLRGYDVVLGKLLATSLRCVFGLLAIFPIIAITQIMGGVELLEFWERLLALLHAVFFSLAAGMFVSSISRHAQKAMTGTLLLILAFLVAGPILDGLIAYLRGENFKPLLSLTSPGFVFVSAGRGMGLFWEAFLPSQIAAWAMLATSCVLIRRTWQEKSSKTSTRMLRWSYWWKYGGLRRRTAFRQKMMSINPIVWLASRERWQRIPAWIVCGGAAVGYAMVFVSGMGPAIWFVWSYMDGLISLLFYLWIASQASQFFAEAKRSGVIELLLATPLTSRQLVQGPWRALLRTFGWPIGLYLVMGVIVPVITLFSEWNQSWDSMLQGMGGSNSKFTMSLTQVGRGIIAAITTAANLAAISWFGMWMGLTSRNATWATLKTLSLVQVLPWMVITYGCMILTSLVLIPALMSSSMSSSNNAAAPFFMMWFPLIKEGAVLVLSVAKDVIFIMFVRKKLGKDFREMAARAVAPVRVPVALPAPPMVVPASVVPAPPVIAKP